MLANSFLKSEFHSIWCLFSLHKQTVNMELECLPVHESSVTAPPLQERLLKLYLYSQNLTNGNQDQNEIQSFIRIPFLMILTQNQVGGKEREGKPYTSVLLAYFLILVVPHVISLALKYTIEHQFLIHTFQNSCEDSKDI